MEVHPTLIVCTRCGFKNENDDADFCASCGRFLEWSGQKVEAPVAAAPPETDEDEEEARRKGFMSRVEGWVREQRTGEGEPGERGGTTAAGTTRVTEDGPPAPEEIGTAGTAAPAAGAADGQNGVTAPAASGAAPPGTPADTIHGPVAGPLPGAAWAPPAGQATHSASTATATETEPVGGSAVEAGPAADEATATTPVFGPPIPLAAGETRTPTEPAADGTTGEQPEKGAATGTSAVAAGLGAGNGVAKPPPINPLLAAFIAKPISVVPDLEPDPVRKPAASTVPSTDEEVPGRPATVARLPEATPARQPTLVRPREVFRPAQYVKEDLGPSKVVREGDIVCPGEPGKPCGQGNYAWRNFCRRCGRPLDHSMTGAGRHGPWRWVWSAMATPVHGRRHRLVTAGARPGRKYEGSRHAGQSHSRGFHVPKPNMKAVGKYLPFIIIILVVLAYFGPFKGLKKDLSRFKNYVEGQINIQYVPLYPAAVSASNSLPAHPPSLVIDNDTTTYWATNAPRPPTGKAKLKGKALTNWESTHPAGTGQVLTLDFSSPELIGGFSIISGPAATNRPHVIRLEFSSAPAETFTLQNIGAGSKNDGFQDFRFLHTSTTFVKMVIISVYGKPAHPTAGVSEIAAYVRS